jgi:hypothetical protein
VPAKRPNPVLAVVLALAAIPSVSAKRLTNHPIMHARVFGNNGRIVQETWTELAGPTSQRSRTVDYDRAGQVGDETAISLHGTTLRRTTVDYRAKAWQTQTIVTPPNATNVGITDSQYFPAELKQLVREHLIGPAAHKKIGGIDTILLQGQLGPDVLQVWVRPGSYLAVQARSGPSGEPASGSDDLIRFSWLTPNSKSFAETGLTVPRGFVQTQ